MARVVLVSLMLAAAVRAGAATATPAPTEVPPTLRVEQAVSREMSRHGIPGLTVAVVLDGQLQWVNGYGLVDLENTVPAKATTVYRIASICKPITAVAAMQLVEQGKLDLDAPIQRYVPSFPEKAAPVTARLLLSHQSGIRHVQDEEWSSTRHYPTIASALDVFKDEPLLFTPGSRTEYSTYGFNLLGAAVEGAAGVGFVEYLRASVLGPAGMDNTQPDDVFEIIPNRAPGYRRIGGGTLVRSALADTSNKIPGGGLCATAPDVARFAVALMAGTLLKRESWDQMMVPQRTRDGRPTGYGLGWRVGTYRGRREVWHHGGQPQVSTLLYMQPDKRFAIVFLANLENVYQPFTELARQLSLAIVR